MARPVVKKESIEEAAIGLFAAHGLAGTTIKEIAARAGVTEGALYRHYAGKDEMAWALCCREAQRLSEGLAPVLANDDGPLGQRLLAAVTHIYRSYRDQPERLLFAMLARRSFPDRDLPDQRIDPDHLVIRFVRREIARGRAHRIDPVLAMSMLRGIVLEPILMHRAGRLRRQPMGLARDVAAACTRVLGGRPVE